MTKEERFILINDFIKAIGQVNLHNKPSEKTLELINELKTFDEVFQQKIGDFIIESRNNHRRTLEQVKIINGSVACISKWKERTKGSLDIIRILLLPIFLAIIYLYLDKFL